MKKISILLILLILTSCSKSIDKIEYELEEETSVYAYNLESKQLEEIQIVYDIKTVEDVFYLYTLYQNNLPIGYVSMASANVGLLDIKIEENTVYYVVDNYVCLVDDLEIFSCLLEKTNMALGYEKTKIIYNGSVIA